MKIVMLVVWNHFSIDWEQSSQLTLIFFRGVGIPPTNFGNPTWLAGKWTIDIGDVPIETSMNREFSSQPSLISRGYNVPNLNVIPRCEPWCWNINLHYSNSPCMEHLGFTTNIGLELCFRSIRLILRYHVSWLHSSSTLHVFGKNISAHESTKRSLTQLMVLQVVLRGSDV